MKKFFLSVHTDSVFDGLDLSLTSAGQRRLGGTLDNFLGVASILSMPILSLINTYKIPVHFTQGEEIDGRGAKSVAAIYDTKEYAAICIDVGKLKLLGDGAAENIHGFGDEIIKGLEDHIRDCNYMFYTRKYTGEEDDEDEAFIYRSKGFDTFTFLFPVEGSFHSKDCCISIYQLIRSQMTLKLVLMYLLSKQIGYGGDSNV